MQAASALRGRVLPRPGLRRAPDTTWPFGTFLGPPPRPPPRARAYRRKARVCVTPVCRDRADQSTDSSRTSGRNASPRSSKWRTGRSSRTRARGAPLRRGLPRGGRVRPRVERAARANGTSAAPRAAAISSPSRRRGRRPGSFAPPRRSERVERLALVRAAEDRVQPPVERLERAHRRRDVRRLRVVHEPHAPPSPAGSRRWARPRSRERSERSPVVEPGRARGRRRRARVIEVVRPGARASAGQRGVRARTRRRRAAPGSAASSKPTGSTATSPAPWRSKMRSLAPRRPRASHAGRGGRA